MARSEDGEFELILGNKQLLSVFFIVVVLLGVFFTMGYIVGKNSVSPDMASGKPPSGAMVVEPTEAEPAPKASGRMVVEPDKPSAMPETSKPTPEPAAKKAEPPPAEEPKSAPAPITHSQVALTPTGEPAPGQTFLQVVASTRPDCEIIVDVLKRKGFPALMAPIPKSELWRVLVGPLTDAAVISKTRTDLEAAGFQKPYLRKY
jgi:outer membrane biosynthesis protein TonB